MNGQRSFTGSQIAPSWVFYPVNEISLILPHSLISPKYKTLGCKLNMYMQQVPEGTEGTQGCHHLQIHRPWQESLGIVKLCLIKFKVWNVLI